METLDLETFSEDEYNDPSEYGEIRASNLTDMEGSVYGDTARGIRFEPEPDIEFYRLDDPAAIHAEIFGEYE